MSEDNFQWTDELVVEFVTWSVTGAPLLQGRYSDIKQFKESKKQKPVLFRTTDGIDIRDGDSYWYIDPSWKLFFNTSASETIKCGTYGGQFSTKEAANEWVLRNKPIFSIAEIDLWALRDGKKWIISPDDLIHAAKSKING